MDARDPDSRRGEIRQRLEAERLRIQREITSYPMPIPACDAFFNHLLEQRALVCDELARLGQVVAQSAGSGDQPAAVVSVIEVSRRATP
jgi:hypothetical protein